jgi:hypothetical protein
VAPQPHRTRARRPGATPALARAPRSGSSPHEVAPPCRPRPSPPLPLPAPLPPCPQAFRLAGVQVEPLDLEWRHIGCSYRSEAGTKVVLQDIFGRAAPGDMQVGQQAGARAEGAAWGQGLAWPCALFVERDPPQFQEPLW